MTSKVSQHENVSESNSNADCRPFLFGEFFAGMEGFFLTLATLGGKLDGFDGWNILEDEGFDRALKICDEADHGHFAPPCRTYSRARRSDEHGSVKNLRNDQHPEGWGDPEAEEANKIISRMVQLILRLLTRNRTFAIENP